MNLYLISVADTVDFEYDSYDSAVVAASDEDAARVTRPDGKATPYSYPPDRYDSGWGDVSPRLEQITVQLIGTTKTHSAGLILASFNAG